MRPLRTDYAARYLGSSQLGEDLAGFGDRHGSKHLSAFVAVDLRFLPIRANCELSGPTAVAAVRDSGDFGGIGVHFGGFGDDAPD